MTDRPTDPSPAPPSTPERAIRVLVIDDEPMSVELLHYSLAPRMRDAIEFIVARSLQQAFHRFEQHETFDVVLLDLGLPGVKGRDTLLQFRKTVPGLPVVVLTGTDDDALRDQLIQDGAFSYLVKGHISATEVANLLFQVTASTRSTYHVTPNEQEVIRLSTAAQSRLKQELSVAPTSRDSARLQDAHARAALATNANEMLILSKMDRLYEAIGELKGEKAATNSRLDRHSERFRALDDKVDDARISTVTTITEMTHGKAHEFKLVELKWRYVVVPVLLAVLGGLGALVKMLL